MIRTQRAVSQFEAAGALIIVAENAYIGKDEEGAKLIALARDYHNGAGRWPESDGGDRWAGFNVPLAPWRDGGSRLLVLPQRGFGSPGVAMPMGWTAGVVPTLRKLTDRKIEVRQHPGIHHAPDPDFTDVWAAITWGSGAAIKALAAGIPVFHQMKKWIGAAAAAKLGERPIEEPWLGDRLPMFERLAWAQWRAGEIETGEPFARLVAL